MEKRGHYSQQLGSLHRWEGCWGYGKGAVLVPDSLLGVPKGFSEAGKVRVEVGGRGDDFQEAGMDLCGEPGGQEGPVHTTGSLLSQWGSGGVGPPLHTHGLSANRGSTLPQTGHYLVGEAGTCLPHPLQRVLPPPAVSVCQYSQGLDVLRHHRGVLWVSLWGDQVPSLSRLPPQMA